MNVLGIETSCDETAAAVVRFEEAGGEGEAAPPRVLSSVAASQDDIHSRFGGVVPELASRRHVELIDPVIRAALEDASLGLGDIGAVAATRGPGLVVSLLVGLSAAKALAWARRLPLVGVHHLDGHIHSLYLDVPPRGGEGGAGAAPLGGPPPFPHLAFVVSGGHTDLYRVEGHGRVRRLGGTLDDAVGEAYDKVGASMGLGYPGGPAVDRLHAAFRAEGTGEPMKFPRPFLKDRPYDFSFSGLKTAVLSYLRKQGHYRDDPRLAPWERPQEIPPGEARAVAAGFQEAAVEVLVEKVDGAARAEGLGAVSVSGGVSANRHLRERLGERARRSGWSLHLPPLRYCTDNAAMIACAGGFALRAGGKEAFMDYLRMDADPAWELADPARELEGEEGKPDAS
ncbi:MAG: tRNA (adenosine(37)-N6)-threonylcarbamoyltransferase complex transferase subunit TsaD [bacterium]